MIDVYKLRELIRASTPGPWEWRNSSDLRTMHDRGDYQYGAPVLTQDVDGLDCDDADRDLIAASVNALPGLLDRLAAAEHVIDATRRNGMLTIETQEALAKYDETAETIR